MLPQTFYSNKEIFLRELIRCVAAPRARRATFLRVSFRAGNRRRAATSPIPSRRDKTRRRLREIPPADRRPPFLTAATLPMRSIRFASRASRTSPGSRARCAREPDDVNAPRLSSHLFFFFVRSRRRGARSDTRSRVRNRARRHRGLAPRSTRAVAPQRRRLSDDADALRVRARARPPQPSPRHVPSRSTDLTVRLPLPFFPPPPRRLTRRSPSSSSTSSRTRRTTRSRSSTPASA